MLKKTIKGTGIDLTPSIDAAVDKLVVSLEKFVDQNDTSALVEVEVGRTTQHHKSGDIFRAEVNFHSRIGSVRAEATSVDLYSAISLVKDDVIESLRSKKAKKETFVRRSAVKLKEMLKGFPWAGK